MAARKQPENNKKHRDPFRTFSWSFALVFVRFVHCSAFAIGKAVCSQNFCSQFLCPLTPPPPNQQNDGFPLEFLSKGPQTELRTLSQNCEQTLQKLRTNRIMNKLAFLICTFCRARHNPEPRSEVWWWHLRWSFGGKCFWRFSQQKKLENLLSNFAGSSPPNSPKTSPTSLWKSLVPKHSCQSDFWFSDVCLGFEAFQERECKAMLAISYLALKVCILFLRCFSWEVLNGVGVDGVGVIFPFFYAFFAF